MKDKSLNREKERLRRRLDNSGFVRAIGWNDNENMITGWTSFTVTLFFLNGHLPEVQQRVRSAAAGVRLCPGIRFTHRKRSKVLYESRLLPAAPGKERTD